MSKAVLKFELVERILQLKAERRKLDQLSANLNPVTQKQMEMLLNGLSHSEWLETNNNEILAATKKLEQLEGKKVREPSIGISLVLLLLVGVFFLGPALTGLITGTGSVQTYTLPIQQIINTNTTIPLALNTSGGLTLLSLSGTYEGDGAVNVWLVVNGTRQLVLDRSDIISKGSAHLTGFVVLDNTDGVEKKANNSESKTEENNPEQIQNNTESTNNTTLELPSDNATEIPSGPLKEKDNTANDTSNKDENKTKDKKQPKDIIANLSYGTTPRFDEDNDGVEINTGGIDFQIATGEDLSVYQVCSQWKVSPVENDSSTYACYGSEACCSLSGLKPTFDSWNQPFILLRGQQGSSDNNTVSSRIVALDSDFTARKSDWQTLPAIFVEPEKAKTIYSFTEICRDSCLIDSLNVSDALLEIEIANGTLTINNLTYSLTIPKLNLTLNQTNNTNNTNNSINETVETVQLQAEVGKPVKWIKSVESDEQNITLELPRWATNITVYKDNQTVDTSKIIIKNGTLLQTQSIEPSSLQTETVIGQTAVNLSENLSLTIQDANGSIQISYETPAPQATEKIISQDKKSVTISSDLHYFNVTVSATLPDSRAKVYWLASPDDYRAYFDSSYRRTEPKRALINGDARFNVTYFDTNNDSIFDTVSWVVPHLSNQTFEIGVIVLNPVTYLRNGDTWVVAFNTTGTADLVINSTNAFWEEIQTDNPSTPDEMRFLNLSCGQTDLASSILVDDYSGSQYNYSQLQQSDSIRPKDLTVPNYSCNETAYFSNYMKKAGYAELMFTFGSETAFALDPTGITTCQNLSAVDTTYTLSNSVNSTGTCFYIINNNITLDCQGYTINYSEDAGESGIWTNGSNDRIVNCVINKTGGTDAGNYGIYVFARNATIMNNSIYTNGTNINYGIRVSGSGNTSIINNTIFTNGNSFGNYGVSLLVGNNSVLNNTISTNGTFQNYGVYVVDGGLNLFSGNVVNTSGSSGGSVSNNYGIRVSGSGSNSVLNNTISTSGTTLATTSNNYGLYVSAGGSNLLSGNVVNTSGSSSNNVGVVLAGSGNNSVLNNSISTNGNSYNSGLNVSGGGSNLLSGNVVSAGGSGIYNFGVVLAGSGNNSVLNNSISTNGTQFNHGLYVSAGGSNLLSGNVVNTSGSSSDNYGVYLLGPGNNSVLNNTISTNGTSYNYGLYVSAGGSNLLSGNVVNTSGSSSDNYGVYLLWTRNNSVLNNTIRTNGTSNNYGLYVYSPVVSTSGSNLLSGNIVTSGGTSTTNHALYLYKSNSSLIANNSFTVASSSGAGINVTESGNNTIYNNIFNGTNVAAWSDAVLSNQWNTTLYSGMNIIGGANIGGNVYSNSSSTEFSDTCPDFDANDICDSSNTFSSNNVDFFPLSTATGRNNLRACGNLTLAANVKLIQNVNATGTCIYINQNNITLDCQGNNINFSTADSGFGIITNGTNVTITNCNITSYGLPATAIYITGNNTTVINNTLSVVRNSAPETIINITGVNSANITNNSMFCGGQGTTTCYGVILDNSKNVRVTNNNITLNYSIRTAYGIYLNSNNFNNTIASNIITVNSSGSSTALGKGISILTGSSSNLVQNNYLSVFTENSADSFANSYDSVGIYLNDTRNNTIQYNFIAVNGKGVTAATGIYLLYSNNNIIFNNTIMANGTINNTGIELLSSNNNTINSNNISANGNMSLYLGAPVSTYGVTGVKLTFSSFNYFENNTVFVNSSLDVVHGWTGFNSGVLFRNFSNFNTIIGNTVLVNGTSGQNYGLVLINTTNFTLINNNTVLTSGTDHNYGIYLFFTKNTTLGYNTIYTSGTSTDNHAIYSNNSNMTVIANNTFQVLSGHGLGGLFSNLSNSSVYNNIFIGSNGSVFVNTTYLNNFSIPLVSVTNIMGGPNFGGNYYSNFTRNDYSNTCNSTILDRICNVNNTLVPYRGGGPANVDNLPIATTIGTMVCDNLTLSNNVYTLSTDVNSTQTCFQILNNNIVLDCASHVINFSQSGTGYGVWSNGTNTTVMNCNITTQSNLSSNVGIYISGNNSLILNNKITTHGTTADYGISVAADYVNITRNNISTNGTGANNYGIAVSASNATIIINNTINSSGGGSGNDGIVLTSGSNYPVVIGNTIFTGGNKTGNIGILENLKTNNSLIANNSIQTNGTSANTGINIQSSINHTILNNTITIGGSSSGSGSVGITLQQVNFTNILNNTIKTSCNASGSSSCYGIALATGSSDNLVYGNSITTSGRGGLNNGIHIPNVGVISVNITNNRISTGGNFSNVGVSMLISVTGNIVINGNMINTTGVLGDNYGIWYSGGTTDSNLTIANNTITSNGAANCVGVAMKTPNAPTTINGNMINTTGTCTNDRGIWLYSQGNAPDIMIANNSIRISSGSGPSYGVLLNSSGNVTVMNNTIQVNGTGTENYGVYLMSNTGLKGTNNIWSNTIITNGTSSNFGILLFNANNNSIVGNVVISNGSGADNHALYVNWSNSTLVANNTFNVGEKVGNGLGLLLSNSNNDVFYNNIFNGTNGSVFVNTTFTNSFNTTPYANTLNIVGGPLIGGNYYGNRSNGEYSDTCQDNDHNGFCDSANTLSQNTIDNYPLTFSQGFSLVTQCMNLTKNTTSYFMMNDVSSPDTCFNITSNNISLYCQGHAVQYANTQRGEGVISNGTFATISGCVIYRLNSALVSDSDMSGIHIWGNGNNTTIVGNSISTSASSNVRSAGIFADSTRNLNITGNNITFDGDHVIILNGSGFVSIINNNITGNGTSGSGTQTGGILFLNSIGNNTISNNFIVSPLEGIDLFLSGGKDVITNNFFNVSYYAVSANGSGNAISWNNISINGTPNRDSSGFILYANNSNINITNNIVNILGGAGYDVYGINSVDSLRTCFGLQIINNTMQLSGRDNEYVYGIDIYYCNASVINNNVINVSSPTRGARGIILLFPNGINITNNNILANATGSGISNYGIEIIGYLNPQNAYPVLIFNNTVTTVGIDAAYGIVLSGSSNVTVAYNTVFTNGTGVENHALYISSSNFSLVANNTFNVVAGHGLGFLASNIANATIYNNIFNGSNASVFVNTTYPNNWSVPVTSTRNIVGLTRVGGNFYANRSNTEFSNTCSDFNGDGICDLPLTNNLTTNNIDLFPLTYPFGILSACGTLNGSNVTYFVVNNVNSTNTCFGINATNITLQCNGHILNYSTNEPGFGIDINSSSKNISIYSCNIVENNASSASSSYGIRFGGDNDFIRIENNSITTKSAGSSGIASFDTNPNQNNITTNNITTYGSNAHGIYYLGNLSTIWLNNITTYGSGANGIYQVGGGANNIFLNNITTFGATSYGINLSLGDYNNLTYNTVNAYSYIGISLNSSNNTLINNTFFGDTIGISVASTSSANLIYNNIFKSTVTPASVSGSPSNNWNTTLLTATNIIGGLSIGGNFYWTPDGVGLSQTCPDLDFNGICDNSYTLASNNIDYYPLATNRTSININCTTLYGDNVQYNMTTDSNATGTCFTVAAARVTLDCQGHRINYSRNDPGFGIYVKPGYSYFKAINCSIYQESTQANSHGIYLQSDGGQNLLSNLTIETQGQGSHGILIGNSSLDNITTTKIHTAGANAHSVDLVNASQDLVAGNILATANMGAEGMELSSSNSNLLINNTINTNWTDAEGMNLSSSNSSTITNNTITSINSSAIQLDADVVSSTIYNNYFNGSVAPISAAGPLKNDWNTTQSSAINIIGGAKIGGNYYANGTGSGFSENCTDSDKDGICDSSYTLATNNIDYFPLTTLTRVLTSCGNLSNPANYVLQNSVNSTGTCFYIINNNITLDCQGFTINYSETIAQAGIWTNGSNARIVNCIINKTGVTGATNYGIYVFARNATIMNNSIYTNGANNNYGVIISGSGNTSIINNTIFTNGNAVSNAGVFFGVGNNSVLNNTISTNGTSTNYGLWVNGGGLNLFSGNVINTSGSSGSNYGVYLLGSGNNSVLNNTIRTNGTSSNTGLYVNTGGSDMLSGNIVGTSGSSSNNHGVLLLGSVNISVLNNTINTNGVGNNFGLYVSGGGWNLFSGNVVNTSGSANGNYGVYLLGFGNNSVLNNSISTNGTDTNYGLYVSAGGLNLISGNVISAGGSSSSNYGVVLIGLGNNSVLNNTINTSGTSTNYGLYVSAGGLNLVSGNVINTNGSANLNYGVYLLGSGNNSVLNNTVRTNGTSSNYGMYVLSNNNSVSGNIVVSGGTSTTNHALYLFRSNSSIIANNSFKVGSSSGAGINVTQSGNNTIYNNIFNATNVAAWSDTVFSNQWNTTLHSRTNIVNGSNLGGNYYANVSKDGFSETCNDDEPNGICDSSYTIATNNVDFYPLTLRTETKPPWWANNGTNETIAWPTMNGSIQMNVTLYDNVGVGFYIFSWNNSGTWQNVSSGTIPGLTPYILEINQTANMTRRGQVGWMVFFNDTNGNGNQTDVFVFTMKNLKPGTPTLLSPDNMNYSYNRTPMLNWTNSTDPDNDTLSFEINITKYSGDGSCTVNSYTNITNIQSAPFALNDTFELQCLRDENYYYNWSVRAFDGENYSDWSTEFNISATGIIGINVLNNTVAFNDMLTGDINDTIDNAPNPFLMENTGNVFVNMTINASPLWTTQPDNSSYYTFSADNASLRNNSFNFSLSNTSLIPMPITGAITYMIDLDYRDTSDWAETEIGIQAPNDEPSGNKQSTVNFRADRSR